MDRAETIARLEKATGLTLSDVSGHKLCDFRPFFALAFAEILEDYEYWGYCDVDMMFGDLNKLLTPEFFDSTDIFTASESGFAGHFTILRNDPIINRSCFKMEGWQERCLSPSWQGMDEWWFFAAINTESSIRIQRPASLGEELNKSFGRFGLTFGFRGEVAYLKHYDVPLVRWENGSVFYTSQSGKATEMLYIHFMGLKQWWHWRFFADTKPSRQVHRFSRLGYGGPSQVRRLSKFPWLQMFWAQSVISYLKRSAGRKLRGILAAEDFLRLRRFLFGGSR